MPKAYNRLFKADQSAHSRPEVTVVSERAFDGDLYLDPWSENAGVINPAVMKGAHSVPWSDKVAVEDCSTERRRMGCSLVL